MKHKLQILLYIMALSVLPLLAGAADSKPVSKVALRLLEAELSRTLQQHERMKTEQFEMMLNLELLNIDEETTGDARKKKAESLSKRIDLFARKTDELHIKALDLEQTIAVSKAK